MSGICGYINYNRYLEKNNINHMIKTLKKRGPNEEGKYYTNHVILGHTRLSIVDIKNGKQPMKIEYKGKTYLIVLDGEIYNYIKLKNELEKKGHKINTNTNAEIILRMYIEYKEKFIEKINGVFALAILDDKKVILARDRLGVKPIYYTITEEEDIVFSSNIKGLLAYRGVYPIIDKESIFQLIGLGPLHIPGKTYFKNINEVKPGNYLILQEDKIIEKEYWRLEEKKCKDNIKKAINKTRFLIKDSIKKRLTSDVGISTIITPEIESGIIAKIAKESIENEIIKTYSIQHENKGKFIKTIENNNVEKMVKYLDTKHRNIKINSNEIFNTLSLSLIARDVPGMVDIDSTMYCLYKEIINENRIVISSECSNEIFIGNPWMYNQNTKEIKMFPWLNSINTRSKLINPQIEGLEEYIKNTYNQFIKKAKINEENVIERKYKEINYLTITYYMQGILEKIDKMGMENSLQVRVPFADYRLCDYIYNLPMKYKIGENKEAKYLLKEVLKSDFPSEIIDSKIYLKKEDKKYLKILEECIKELILDKKNKIFKILNKEYLEEIIKTHGKNIDKEFFSNFMSYKQLLEYILQIDAWLEIYNIKIEI